MSIGSISDSFARTMALSAVPPTPMPSMPGGHQPAPIAGTVSSTQSTIESRRIQHRELRLVLGAAALRGDRDLHACRRRPARRARRPACCRRCSSARTAGPRRSTRAAVVGVAVAAAHALVDQLLQRARRVPAHVHADLHEHVDDAGVLADRALALGAHPRIGQDLRDRVLRRRRLLALVRAAEVLDVVGGVVVGDELQRVGDALHEIGFTDHGAHGPGILPDERRPAGEEGVVALDRHEADQHQQARAAAPGSRT